MAFERICVSRGFEFRKSYGIMLILCSDIKMKGWEIKRWMNGSIVKVQHICIKIVLRVVLIEDSSCRAR